MKLSEKLIKLRKEKGLSQEEFGNEINVSRQAVSKWENDETKPDTEKIQEIVKKFGLSYEYLLNDECEEINQDTKKDKKGIKLIFKIFIVLLIIYLLISAYKFITFYRFYLVANSFSEDNYSMYQDFNGRTEIQGYYGMQFLTTKVGNKIIKKSSFQRDNEEKYNSVFNSISFIDLENKKYYTLNFDESTNKYIYEDMNDNLAQGETIDDVLENYKVNEVKETTLSQIPSNFKEIFLASINPFYYYVDIVNREFKTFSIQNNLKMIVKLNNDFLVENLTQISEDEGAYLSSYFSYDYVQDHFEEIIEPTETYQDQIVYE